jgi:hypothetical protein
MAQPKKQKPRWMQSSAKRGITAQIYNLSLQKDKNILTNGQILFN